MAEPAHIYIMRAPNGALKVGFSINPEQRRRSLGADIALVHTTDVIEDARRVEGLAHRLLVLNGKPIKGEWFEASLEAAIDAVEAAIKQAEGLELVLGGDFVRHGLSAEMIPKTPPNPEWKRLGRPPKGDATMMERINIRIPPAMMRKIEEITSSRIDKPDKAVVIRELLAVALERYENNGL